MGGDGELIERPSEGFPWVSFIEWLPLIPFLALLYAFVADYEQFELVRLNGGAHLPLAYKVSAVWAGREGPLLLWAALLTICTKFYAKRGTSEASLMANRIANGMVVTILLIAFMMDPFRSSTGTARGELNPLLQTDLMVIHPPVVFLFYSLCMVVTAHGLASLVTKEASMSELRSRVLPATRAGFVVGTAGIGLGGLWAYTVLDWGGYWAWDPVETASLLPWLCLLMLLHVRVTPGKSVTELLPVLAVLPGWFAIHATMVTRANGVWASVHAFVGDGLTNERPQAAISRLMDLQGEGVAGSEVTSYLVSLAILFAIIIAATCLRQSGLSLSLDIERVWKWSFTLVPAIPVLAWLFEGSSPLEAMPPELLLGLALTPLWVIFLPPFSVASHSPRTKADVFDMAAVLVLAAMASDPIVGILSVAFVLLRTFATDSHRIIWMTAGTILAVTSLYAYLIELPVAAGLCVVNLWQVAVSDSDDGGQNISEAFPLTDDRFTSRIARYAPSVLGATFLCLTWMLLLMSVDGTSLAAHEVFGGVILLGVVSAFAFYAWKGVVEPRLALVSWIGAIGVGALLGFTDFAKLPGDGDEELLVGISRAALVWIMLPLTLLTIPAVARLSFVSLKAYSSSKRSTSAISSLAHFAHFGILLLLVGHLLTTTLVDRSDPSHQVVLVQDQETFHDGYGMTFEGWVVLSDDDSEFDSRFSVGDGYLGSTISVSDTNGKELGTVEPGMLRFDASNGFPRSEVARLQTWSGDIVFIFDWSQTQDLGNASMSADGLDVDRVRLTVYTLHGSHLVWIGWSIIVFSSALIALLERKKA